MSEEADHESKTEEASEKRLQEALNRGDAPFSRELPLLASLAAMLITLIYLLPSSLVVMGEALVRFVDEPSGWRVETPRDFLLLASPILMASLRMLAPILFTIASFGLAASISQNGLQFAPDRIIPSLSRISPSAGLSRIMGLRGLVEFGKNLVKFGAVALIASGVLRAKAPTLLTSIFVETTFLPQQIMLLSAQLIGSVLALLTVIAVGDLVWSRIRWRRDQRMSKQEVKEELRQMEGDPVLKSRLRSLRLHRSRNRMLAAVPKATMVIANPTHYAVALRYVEGKDQAPIVLAKGKNLVALKIRETAEECEIPVIEDKPLAQSLYKSVTVNQPIPAEFYRAIAEIVHLLKQTKRIKSHAN